MKYHRPFRGLYSFYYPFDVPYLSISDVSGNASNWDNKLCKNTSQNVIYVCNTKKNPYILIFLVLQKWARLILNYTISTNEMHVTFHLVRGNLKYITTYRCVKKIRVTDETSNNLPFKVQKSTACFFLCLTLQPFKHDIIWLVIYWRFRN